jgi:hypothetical protein
MTSRSSKVDVEPRSPEAGEWHEDKTCAFCGAVGDCVATWEDNGATYDLLWECPGCAGEPGSW